MTVVMPQMIETTVPESNFLDVPVFGVVGSVLLPELEAAGGFNEAQVRVRKGNREGGRWLDTAGGLARGLEEGTLWSLPGDDTGVYALPKHSARVLPAAAAKDVLDAGMAVPDQSKVIPYTGGAYALANDTLRGPGSNPNLRGMVDDNTIPRELWTKNGSSAERIVADLDSQVAPLSDDMIFYRGLNKNDAFGTENPGELIGKVVQDKGFMSTSYDKDRYPPLNEVGHPAGRLRISAPKGSRVIYAQPVSAFPQEGEVILDRGTRLAITGYDPYTGFIDAVIVSDPITTAVSPELVAAAAEPTYTGSIVALIPAISDPITAASSEPAHITVVWMGDVADLEDVEQLKAEVGAYADKLTPITVPVQGRETFDEGAEVVLLEPTDSLVAMRDGLLADSPSIAAAQAAVEQYPQWNPHVTLGYPDSPPVDPGYAGETVTFDRLGLWAGDERHDFLLNGALTAAGDDGWAEGGGNPEQARVPRGNGRLSGRWTPGAGALADHLNAKLGGSLNKDVGSDVSGYHQRELMAYDSPQARERFRDFDQQGRAANGADALDRAYKITGYDKTKPTFVDELPEGVTPIYRGTPYTEQFLNGDHFPGHGFYGNGSYFTTDAKQALQGYGKNNPANVTTAAWKPDARVLELKHMWPGGTFYDDDVDHHLMNLNDALGGTSESYFKQVESSALLDLGAAAALLGYDGIHITHPKGQKQDYDIVFNREALLVKKGI